MTSPYRSKSISVRHKHGRTIAILSFVILAGVIGSVEIGRAASPAVFGCPGDFWDFTISNGTSAMEIPASFGNANTCLPLGAFVIGNTSGDTGPLTVGGAITNPITNPGAGVTIPIETQPFSGGLTLNHGALGIGNHSKLLGGSLTIAIDGGALTLTEIDAAAKPATPVNSKILESGIEGDAGSGSVSGLMTVMNGGAIPPGVPTGGARPGKITLTANANVHLRLQVVHTSPFSQVGTTNLMSLTVNAPLAVTLGYPYFRYRRPWEHGRQY